MPVGDRPDRANVYEIPEQHGIKLVGDPTDDSAVDEIHE